MSPWNQIRQLFIEFFNRLGQLQAPDADIAFTSCPLRRLPKVAISQCPKQTIKKR